MTLHAVTELGMSILGLLYHHLVMKMMVEDTSLVIKLGMSIQGLLSRHLVMMMMVEDTGLDVQVPGEMAGSQCTQIRDAILVTNYICLNKTGSRMRMMLLLLLLLRGDFQGQGLGHLHLISQRLSLNLILQVFVEKR